MRAKGKEQRAKNKEKREQKENPQGGLEKGQ
jgi:hypothetical protein